MEIGFDKRIELLYGLQYCVEKDYPQTLYPEGGFFNDTLPSYMDAFYQKYKRHASEELINYIRMGGFDTYDRTIRIGLALDDSYGVVISEEIRAIQRRNPYFSVEQMERLLQDFVKKSEYESFWEEQQDILNRVVEAYKMGIKESGNFDADVLVDFYGYRIGEFRIGLLNYIRGGFGMHMVDTIVNYQGFRNIGEDEENIMINSTSIIITCLHEFSHPYLNPLGYRYLQGENVSRIYEQAIEDGLHPCYHDPITFVNEYLVRGVQFFLGSRYISREELAPMIDWHIKGLGFRDIEEIMSLLVNVKEYDSFERFYVEKVIPFFTDCRTSHI